MISQKCYHEVSWNKQLYDSGQVLPNAFPNSVPRSQRRECRVGRWSVARPLAGGLRAGEEGRPGRCACESGRATAGGLAWPPGGGRRPPLGTRGSNRRAAPGVR